VSSVRLRYFFALVVLAFTAQAGTVTPTWNFQDYTGGAYGYNSITIQPMLPVSTDGAQYYFVGDPITKNTSGGSFTTNLLNGYAYKVTFAGRFSNYSLTNYFGTNVTGSVNAATYTAVSTNITTGLYAYSMAAADARFAYVLIEGTNNSLANGVLTVKTNYSSGGGSGDALVAGYGLSLTNIGGTNNLSVQTNFFDLYGDWFKAVTYLATTGTVYHAQNSDNATMATYATGSGSAASYTGSVNYNQVTNPPAIPSTNGFVTATVTNGLASIGYVNSVSNVLAASIPSTNGFVTAAITNGLATTGYVAQATSGMVTNLPPSNGSNDQALLSAAVSVPNRVIILSPQTTYYASNLFITNHIFLDLNGSTIAMMSGATNALIDTGDNNSDQSVVNGTLDGGNTGDFVYGSTIPMPINHPVFPGYGSSMSNRFGLTWNASAGGQISHLFIKGFNGIGLAVRCWRGTESMKYTNSTIDNVTVFNNFAGVVDSGYGFQYYYNQFTHDPNSYAYDSGEYINFQGLTAKQNGIGLAIGAGNDRITGAMVTDNYIGMIADGGPNAAHGIFSDVTMNHNVYPFAFAGAGEIRFTDSYLQVNTYAGQVTSASALDFISSAILTGIVVTNKTGEPNPPNLGIYSCSIGDTITNLVSVPAPNGTCYFYGNHYSASGAISDGTDTNGCGKITSAGVTYAGGGTSLNTNTVAGIVSNTVTTSYVAGLGYPNPTNFNHVVVSNNAYSGGVTMGSIFVSSSLSSNYAVIGMASDGMTPIFKGYNFSSNQISQCYVSGVPLVLNPDSSPVGVGKLNPTNTLDVGGTIGDQYGQLPPSNLIQTNSNQFTSWTIGNNLDGGMFTNLTAGNIVGTVANANYANQAGNAYSAGIANRAAFAVIATNAPDGNAIASLNAATNIANAAVAPYTNQVTTAAITNANGLTTNSTLNAALISGILPMGTLTTDTVTTNGVLYYKNATTRGITNAPTLNLANSTNYTGAIALSQLPSQVLTNGAAYQPTNANLTTLATLNGNSLTNINPANIASGNLPSTVTNTAPIAATNVTGTISATNVQNTYQVVSIYNYSGLNAGQNFFATGPATAASYLYCQMPAGFTGIITNLTIGELYPPLGVGTNLVCYFYTNGVSCSNSYSFTYVGGTTYPNVQMSTNGSLTIASPTDLVSLVIFSSNSTPAIRTTITWRQQIKP